MALKDLLGFIDNKLRDTFAAKPFDRSAARKPLLRKINQTQKQFENGSTKAPGRWWKVSNDVVEFSPVLNGHSLTINGEATNYIPSASFPQFIQAFRDAVEAGELDDQLEAIEKGREGGNQSATISMGRPRRKMSEEAKAKMRLAAQKREARKRGEAVD